MNATETDREALKARLVKSANVLLRVGYERERQNALHPDKNCSMPEVSNDRKLAILMEEVGEVAKELNELDLGRTGIERCKANLREELIQVAAVAVAWVESLEG